jgi:hypothetical protein
MCKHLNTHTTQSDIFSLIDLYMAGKAMVRKSVDICTNGARLVVMKKRGFIAHVKAVAPECSSSNCIIHRQALAV